MSRTCSACSALITARSRMGFCRRCAVRERNRLPEYRAKASAAMIARRAAGVVWTGNRTMEWCPREWRRRYECLRRKVGRIDAKRFVLEEMAAAA